MPLYDRLCPHCGAKFLDVWEPVVVTDAPQCATCGAATERAWLSTPANVIPDEIPGGIEIRHGLVHDDGSPRWFYSKSEMRREAARLGLRNRVEHLGRPGSDKSPHTSRWI